MNLLICISLFCSYICSNLLRKSAQICHISLLKVCNKIDVMNALYDCSKIMCLLHQGLLQILTQTCSKSGKMSAINLQWILLKCLHMFFICICTYSSYKTTFILHKHLHIFFIYICIYSSFIILLTHILAATLFQANPSHISLLYICSPSFLNLLWIFF